MIHHYVSSIGCMMALSSLWCVNEEQTNSAAIKEPEISFSVHMMVTITAIEYKAFCGVHFHKMSLFQSYYHC